ncbi:MAG TPA: DUF992 domain-containing protein [Xanthobacteraceae bacterium]|jgi:hypothetical protein|nr:DUF992 domain-containing protein [Xanthobacteraceae bacterium]
MKRLSLICALGLAALAASAPAASAQSPVQVGVLECRGAATTSFIVGSVHEMRCTLRSSITGRHNYVGVVRRVGFDVGFTDRSVLAWAVLAPTRKIGAGDLAGTYAGVSAGATIGIGGNANVLVGGLSNSIALQPLSLEGQQGLNIAAGVADLKLSPAR